MNLFYGMAWSMERERKGVYLLFAAWASTPSVVLQSSGCGGMGVRTFGMTSDAQKRAPCFESNNGRWREINAKDRPGDCLEYVDRRGCCGFSALRCCIDFFSFPPSSGMQLTRGFLRPQGRGPEGIDHLPESRS